MAGIRVVSLAVNLPGPLTAARYVELGAHVTKIVPPGGDPLQWVSPEWHDNLKEDQEVLTLDLKSEGGQAQLAQLLCRGRRLADRDPARGAWRGLASTGPPCRPTTRGCATWRSSATPRPTRTGPDTT